MERRRVLKTVGGSVAVSIPILGGCLGASDNNNNSANADYRWKYDVGGRVDAVSRGTVFGRELYDSNNGDGFLGGLFDSGPTANGQVVALDAETGKPRWTYGNPGQHDSYAPLTVADGVYFNRCGDDDCIGLHALEIDGTKRWSRNINIRRSSPFVVDGLVYVDNGNGVTAVDAETGKNRWTHEESSSQETPPFLPRRSLIDVTDVVYANDGDLVALDQVDGSTVWRYDIEERRASAVVTISKDTAYLQVNNRVLAVADGKELWSTDIDKSEPQLDRSIAVASDRVFVRYGPENEPGRLYAFDANTGEQSWTVDIPSNALVEVHDSVAYVVGDEIRALDPTTGDQKWRTSTDHSSIYSATVVSADDEQEHTLFAEYRANQIVGFSSDGKQTWEQSINGIESYVINDAVFVGASDGIYAFDR